MLGPEPGRASTFAATSGMPCARRSQGWFGQRNLFVMGRRYEPAEGSSASRREAVIVGVVAVESAVELLLEAGVEALHEKSVGLTKLTVALTTTGSRASASGSTPCARPPVEAGTVDVWDAVDRLARLVESGEYREVDATPARAI